MLRFNFYSLVLKTGDIDVSTKKGALFRLGQGSPRAYFTRELEKLLIKITLYVARLTARF